MLNFGSSTYQEVVALLCFILILKNLSLENAYGPLSLLPLRLVHLDIISKNFFQIPQL